MGGCLTAQLHGQLISIAAWGGSTSRYATTLRVHGDPWRRLAGAVVHCDVVPHLIPRQDMDASKWCLVLAGWDGRGIPIAVLPWQEGHHQLEVEELRPLLYIPMQTREGGAQSITSLHLAADSLQLHAISAAPHAAWELRYWDLTAHMGTSA
eukprot:544689-Amphidinium_carterae.1